MSPNKPDPDSNLARQIDAAQSILELPAAKEARRLEWAQATTCAASAKAMALLDPQSGAGTLIKDAGMAIFAGAGNPLTQGMGMGLFGPLRAEDLDEMEAFLAPSGGPRQFELCPFADPSLSQLFAERGYRIHEWQLVWTRPVTKDDRGLAGAPEGVSIRKVQKGEERIFMRAVMAGFLETEEVPEESLDLLLPTTMASCFEAYVALIGDRVVGGASLSYADGVAMIMGSGVRKEFRRRGIQGALIRTRLIRAYELGCNTAMSSTLPGTASRRNMERHGFVVAYPKLVMLWDKAGS